MRRFIFIYFIIFLLGLRAQENSPIADSLYKVLKTQRGMARFYTLDHLFEYYRTNQLDSAQNIIMRMEKINKDLKQPELEALIAKNRGLIYMYRSDYFKAEQYVKEAIRIEIQHRLPVRLAESYRILAGIYNKQGKMKPAAEYLSEALQLNMELHDYKGTVMCLNNLGILYMNGMQNKKSLEYFNKALHLIDEKQINDYDKTNLYHNLGIIYRHLDNYDSSYYYHRLALQMSLQNNDLMNVLTGYKHLSRLFMKDKQEDSTLYYLQKAIRLAQTSFPEQLSPLYTTKGKWYYENGAYHKAIEYLHKALQIGQTNYNLIDQEYALYYLYKTYQSIGNYQNAIRYLENLVDIQDSIQMEKALVEINRMEEKYENEKKQLRIEQLEKIQKMDRKIKYLLGAILLLVIFIGSFIIYHLFQRHRYNRVEKLRLEKDVQFKNKQLTSQALMMMQKNKLLNEILRTLSELKFANIKTRQEITKLKRKLKRNMHAENDWELFRQYFEMVNKDFFDKLLKINNNLSPSELKLAALTKLRFKIKDSAILLNISPDSVKSARHSIRKKLGLKRKDNLYEFLNKL